MSRLFKGIAVTLLVGCVAGGVAVSIWAGIRAAEIVGPTGMRSDAEGNVWILSDRELYRLSPDGAVTQILSLDTLQVGAVSDFLPEPSGGLLVGDARRKQILRHGQGGSTTIITLRENPEERSLGTFKFDVDRTTGHVFVADTTRHEIRVFDADGRAVRRFGQQGDGPADFHFPNRITIASDGLLYIADTNNHRIAIYRLDGQLITTLPAPSELTGPYVWPTSFALGPDSNLVVVNKDGALRTGNLLMLDQHSGRTDSVTLPPGAEPESVVVRDSDILISDPGLMMIARLSHDGRFLGAFGDIVLLTRLYETAQTRDRFVRIQNWSRILLIAILIVLIAVLYKVRRTNAKILPTESDPLANRLSLRPPIVEPVTLGWKRIYLWIIIVAAYAAVTGLFVALVFIDRHTGGRPLQTPEIAQVVVINLAAIVFIVILSFIAARMARLGIFIKGRLKLEQRLLGKYQNVLAKLLKPHERLVSYTLGAALPTAFTLGPTFVVVTTEHVLLLRKARWGARIQRVHAIQLSGLHAVETGFPRQRKFWFAKQAGAGLLSIRLAGEPDAIQLIFPRAAQAEEITAAIAAQRPTSNASHGIFEVCTRCLATVAPNALQCSRCSLRVVSWKRALGWSIVYPGLGQLANHNLLKACLFLLLGTNVAVWLGFQLMALFDGTSEVAAFEFVNGIGWVVLIWLTSAQDAYYAARSPVR